MMKNFRLLFQIVIISLLNLFQGLHAQNCKNVLILRFKADNTIQKIANNVTNGFEIALNKHGGCGNIVKRSNLADIQKILIDEKNINTKNKEILKKENIENVTFGKIDYDLQTKKYKILVEIINLNGVLLKKHVKEFNEIEISDNALANKNLEIFVDEMFQLNSILEELNIAANASTNNQNNLIIYLLNKNRYTNYFIENVYLQNLLGSQYWNIGYTQNALDLFRRVSLMKDTDGYAEYYIGLAFKDGISYDMNLDSAAYWLKKSALLGYYEGKYMYSNLLVKSNTNEAIFWLKEAAKNKHPAANRILGIEYANGVIVPKDTMLSYKYLSFASLLGDCEAHYLMGLINSGEYYYKVLPINYETAFNYFNKVNSNCNSYWDAQTEIALMYNNGKGVKKDACIAKQILQNIERVTGSFDSQRILGLIYEFGSCEENINMKIAIEYYTKCKFQNDKLCSEALERIANLIKK